VYNIVTVVMCAECGCSSQAVTEIFCEGQTDGKTEGRKDGKTERRKDGKTDGDHFYSPPPGRRGTIKAIQPLYWRNVIGTDTFGYDQLGECLFLD